MFPVDTGTETTDRTFHAGVIQLLLSGTHKQILRVQQTFDTQNQVTK